MTEPDSQRAGSRRPRLVYHSPLRRWSPLTREEGQEANRFINTIVRFPYLTAATVALLVWFYLVQLIFGWPLIWTLPSGLSLPTELVMEAIGARMGWLDGDAVRAGDWWRLISATLLHGSVLHLAGNAFVLFFLGRIVENLHGRAAYVVAYVGAGVAGGLLSMWASGVNSLGASGAILGLLGMIAALGLRYNHQIPRALRDYFRLDIWFFVGFVALMSLMPAVDWAGHLGGFVFGFILGLAWPAALLEERPPRGDRLRMACALACAGLFLAGLGVVTQRIWQTSQWMPASEIRAMTDAVDRGDFDQAERMARRLESQIPQADSLRYLQVSVLFAAERYEEALVLLDTVAADRPSLLPLKIGAAFEADRPDLARDALRIQERAAAREFASTGGDNSLAWALFLAEPDNPEAVTEGLMRVRRALKRKDERAFRNTLAYGLLLSGEPRRALKVADGLMAGQPRAKQAADVFIRVMALVDLGRIDEAAAQYRSFAPEFPDGTLLEEAAARLTAAGVAVD